jgi:hypothetical protein
MSLSTALATRGFRWLGDVDGFASLSARNSRMPTPGCHGPPYLIETSATYKAPAPTQRSASQGLVVPLALLVGCGMWVRTDMGSVASLSGWRGAGAAPP